MKITKIESCPFCGGECEIILRGNAFTKSRSAEATCKNCRATIKVAAIHGPLEWCHDMVIEKWNKRTGI